MSEVADVELLRFRQSGAQLVDLAARVVEAAGVFFGLAQHLLIFGDQKNDGGANLIRTRRRRDDFIMAFAQGCGIGLVALEMGAHQRQDRIELAVELLARRVDAAHPGPAAGLVGGAAEQFEEARRAQRQPDEAEGGDGEIAGEGERFMHDPQRLAGRGDIGALPGVERPGPQGGEIRRGQHPESARDAGAGQRDDDGDGGPYRKSPTQPHLSSHRSSARGGSRKSCPPRNARVTPIRRKANRRALGVFSLTRRSRLSRS
ncbi:hypothetical protein [Methylosinus trichosporium]|uniref:hypothetical protein n=1 Tax=Methylosinus trichosporium TaxID=426 RepID=UPI0024B987E4|nr:hypothetical protein [Methylosinus trichosporium]